MRLNEFQERFKDLMLDDPKVLDHPPGDLAAFCAEGDIPLPKRLSVYRNNIVGSLTDVMVATFPVTDKLVGRGFLELMARSFILKNPPEQGCLSLYGEGFAEFVEGFELAKSLPYLPDIVRFELALNKAYYAADDAALTAEALGAVSPEKLGDLQLSLRDSVHLVQSRFPLTAIRDFCMAEAPGEKLDIGQGGERLMIYRPDLESVSVPLEGAEYMMLEHLHAGRALGDAVESLLNKHENFDFQGFLQKHLALETFKALPANII
jgi:hypothetical protein